MRDPSPKVVFRPPRELRAKMELFKKEMEYQTGKKLSMSKVLNAVLEEFFTVQRPPVAFNQTGGKR